jgi:hypothetical protein
LESVEKNWRGIPLMFIISIGILVVALLSIDPWVSLLAGILILILIRKILRPVYINMALSASLAFTTVIALMLALLFNFYTLDLGYHLKELGIAVACLAIGFLIVLSMVSHSRLTMNRSMAVLTVLFVALFLITLLILNLLVFDSLTGHSLIIDNRWMMFVVSDIGFMILGMWVVMVIFRRSIPFEGSAGGPT